MKLALALTALSMVISASSAFAADVIGCRRTPSIPFVSTIEYEYRHSGNSLSLEIIKFDGLSARSNLENGLRRALNGAPAADTNKLIETLQRANLKQASGGAAGTLVKLDWDGRATTIDIDGGRTTVDSNVVNTLATYIETNILAQKEYGSDLGACARN